MNLVIGREEQLQLLDDALYSNKSELVVVYGRRRVGKTFLIREAYKKYCVLEVSGIPDGSYKDQLTNFHNAICRKNKSFSALEKPENWLEAFAMLSDYLDTLQSDTKKVVFLDEFPWMYTRRSKFVQFFGHFWNSFCSHRRDLIIVICGSAASFMVNRVINDRKGLHNRITIPIRLLPFNLYETELFLKSKNVHLDRYSYLQLYMAIGGIPHYLDKIQSGDSVPVAIDRLCFKPNGILVNEFNQVFVSLFDDSDNHIRIVEALSTSQSGISREELVTKTNISSGGTLTTTLSELSESGFISEYRPYSNKKKETLYRLTDEYSIFYLKYIKNNKGRSWKTLYTSRSYASWSGFAFETLCLKHIQQLLKGLGISGIEVLSSSWRNENAQIDLLIDRSDRSVNICEMKFSEHEFTINKSYAANVQKKKTEFINAMSKRKNVFVTFVTTFGVKPNVYSNQVMNNQITIDSLFQKD
ncbi:AAA family ATPase [Psychroserpens mesophilus]|uniref:AAA family ATPase n=1 Tax=Psychroserpens mesophilus TaxID=325473 RepID=UPI00058EEBBE|nr:ATP-binding protein [Psychroserpens mesophilus]